MPIIMNKKTTVDPTPAVLPTVFIWDGGGKVVFISGTFSDWKPIPMVKSHGDFVTIIDLPEGEHQYKFYVDDEDLTRNWSLELCWHVHFKLQNQIGIFKVLRFKKESFFL